MTTAYFDCQAGASGNMVLGALLDAGLDKTRLLSELQKLDLPPWELRDERVRRGLIQARLVDFDIQNRGGHHLYADIDACIAEADLGARVKARGAPSLSPHCRSRGRHPRHRRRRGRVSRGRGRRLGAGRGWRRCGV